MHQQWTAAGAGALGAADLGWQEPSWRRSPLTHHRAARAYTGPGKQTLGGHSKQSLVGTRAQEKGALTPQETDPDFPGSAQGSLGGVGRRGPAAGLGALRAAVHHGTF